MPQNISLTKPGTIAISGMKFYAHHGVYAEEQLIGGEYTVDVFIDTDFKKAVENDDLTGTINYETVYLVTKFEMNIPTNLLETLAYRILDKLKAQFSVIAVLKIRITKHFPPLGASVDNTMVEVIQDYRSICPATKKPFLCYKDTNCWCHTLPIFTETLNSLKRQYPGQCVSPDVLKQYTKKD